MSKAQTLAEIKAQMEELQRKADEIINADREAVIAEVKAKIADYKLTAADLGLAVTKTTRKASDGATKTKAPVAYKNEAGLTWTGGRGPKPKWVKEILDAGGDIEKYRI